MKNETLKILYSMSLALIRPVIILATYKIADYSIGYGLFLLFFDLPISFLHRGLMSSFGGTIFPTVIVTFVFDFLSFYLLIIKFSKRNTI